MRTSLVSVWPSGTRGVDRRLSRRYGRHHVRGTEGTPANRSMGLLVVRNVLPDGKYERDSMGYFMIGPDLTDFYPHE